MGYAGHAWLGSLDEWQARFRAEATRHARLRANAASELEALWHAVLEVLCRLASGAVVGLAAGYASHVLLDAFTPGGLPIVA